MCSKGWLVGACLLIAGAMSGPAAAEDRIGDCALAGPAGAYAIQPARPGRLTVQVHLPAPAWWNGDAAHDIRGGFEYCLAANIAHRAGLGEIEVVNVAWPGTAAGAAFWDAILAAQDLAFDLALSEISVTPERGRQVAFSVPYYRTDIGVMAKAGREPDLADIRVLRIGVQAGTTGALFVEKELRPERPARSFGDAPALFMALRSGAIDVAMTDTAILLSQAAESRGRFVVVGQFATDEDYGAVYPKGSPNNAVLDEIIRALIEDGTVARLTATWLTAVWGQDPAKVPYLIVAPPTSG
ncbi:MAG: ABC transporter substrate-binding protein [Geminicoccaceae bacterium]